MANTNVQLEVEDWVRNEWLPRQFGQGFHRDRIRLSSGGVFDFDGVSDDKKMLVCISTSTARTSGGNHAVGKMMKIRSDLYFLLLANAERRIAAFTDKGMHDAWLTEKANGRVPAHIEFALVGNLPEELLTRLRASQSDASVEVSPQRSRGNREQSETPR